VIHTDGPAGPGSPVPGHQGRRWCSPPAGSATSRTAAAEGGIAAETRQVCENLKAILEAAGSSLVRVVKVTIYMVDLGEVLAMNAVFSQYFPEDPPARTTFECSRLIGNARVEIEAIAMAG
jgi:2-iminobutanoate/2-iminopropanoate deaminase